MPIFHIKNDSNGKNKKRHDVNHRTLSRILVLAKKLFYFPCFQCT